MSVGREKEAKLLLPNRVLLEQVQQYLQQGKSLRIPVKGGSMKPFLLPGDQVLLQPVEKGDLQLGLILLAKHEGSLVLHRLVRHNQDGIWLAGDANLAQHEQLNHSDVLAKAVRVYRVKLEIDLEQWWRAYLGQGWYRARPLRRILKKLF